jgi:hypothetical protein
MVGDGSFDEIIQKRIASETRRLKMSYVFASDTIVRWSGAEIANDIAPFVDVGRRPDLPAAIEKMRPDSFHGEQRCGVDIRLARFRMC